FRLAKSAEILHGNPFVAGHIRRRNNAFDLDQLSKLFRRAFEGNAGRAHGRLEVGGTEHFAGNTEQQIVLPLHVFRGMRQGKADFAGPVDISCHGQQDITSAQPVAASKARAISASSDGERTVLKSSRTRPSSTRATTGGL